MTDQPAGYHIACLGDGAAILDFGNVISESLNDKVLAAGEWLRRHPFTGLLDVVTAYSSLTVLYDAFAIHRQPQLRTTAFEYVSDKLHEAACSPANAVAATRSVSIPVCYHAQYGYDIAEVASAAGLSEEELVALHTAGSYRVYMLGFLPGFAYMGRLDARLVMPRKTNPRQHVPAGSVGIAGWQTGIYPLPSPGGWQIIGRTPLKLFDAAQDPPVMLAPGDTVQFYPISLEAFNQLCQ